jgi:hypothetical protein
MGGRPCRTRGSRKDISRDTDLLSLTSCNVLPPVCERSLTGDWSNLRTLRNKSSRIMRLDRLGHL